MGDKQPEAPANRFAVFSDVELTVLKEAMQIKGYGMRYERNEGSQALQAMWLELTKEMLERGIATTG